jgi:hypothetical protein
VFCRGQVSRCGKALLILFIAYLQNRVLKECRNADAMCSVKVLEEVKARLEEVYVEDIEREIFT